VTGGRRTILIVEDNLPLLTLLTEALIEEGYSVLAAPDRPSALNQLRSAMPDVAIVDVDLGEQGSGLDLLPVLRARTGGAVKILLATGLVASFGDRDQAPDAVLTKPFGLDDLLRAVRALID
jgi:DNA-binding response OmpR family regulator